MAPAAARPQERNLGHRLEVRVADLVRLSIGILLAQRLQLRVVHRIIFITPRSRHAHAEITAPAG